MTDLKNKQTLCPKRLLLIDDDALLLNTLENSFSDAGYLIETAADGESGLTKLLAKTETKIDLVILDWKMPDLTGMEVLRQARDSGVTTPIIFLTGLSEPIYEESALAYGATDFVEKSRGFNILLKRVELVIGSTDKSIKVECEDKKALTLGPLKLDSESHRAVWDGKEVRLTLSEFAIVKLIAVRAGHDVEFKEIHRLVHGEGFSVGYGAEGYRGNVRTFIKRIRKKFHEIDSTFMAIENFPGFGYRWNVPE